MLLKPQQNAQFPVTRFYKALLYGPLNVCQTCGRLYNFFLHIKGRLHHSSFTYHTHIVWTKYSTVYTIEKYVLVLVTTVGIVACQVTYASFKKFQVRPRTHNVVCCLHSKQTCAHFCSSRFSIEF